MWPAIVCVGGGGVPEQGGTELDLTVAPPSPAESFTWMRYVFVPVGPVKGPNEYVAVLPPLNVAVAVLPESFQLGGLFTWYQSESVTVPLNVPLVRLTVPVNPPAVSPVLLKLELLIQGT